MSTSEFAAVHEAALLRARTHKTRPSDQDCLDIAQEVALRFARQEPGSIANPAAWANKVADNVCFTFAREGRRHGGSLSEEDDADALEAFVTGGQPTSEGAIARQQAGRLIAMLSARERELVQLVVEGTPHADIAEAMGYANADSVKTTLSRLRKRLLAAALDAGVDPDWQAHPRSY